MANKTLDVTLNSGGTLTISPTDLSIDTNDELYLNVSLGTGITTGHTYDYSFDFSPNTSPLSNDSGSGLSLDTDIDVGSEDYTSTETVSYTLTITYDGTDYSDDPKLKINQPPSN